RLRKLLRLLIEAPRNLLVGRIEPQREVRSQHRRRMAFRFVMCIRHRFRSSPFLRPPLMRARRTLRQLPFIPKKIRKEIVAPLRWRRGPNHFESAANCVAAYARAELALPSE